MIDKNTLNEFIDYTLLKPFATEKEIEKLCATAIEQKYYAVCVPPMYIQKAIRLVREESIKVATVAAFPLGFYLPKQKAQEITEYVENGADEIDMVINLSALKSKQYDIIAEELTLAVEICSDEDVLLKIIIESGNLTEEEIKTVCEIAADAKVDFVKTSTGFLGTGAELEKVKLMREILPSYIKIKASGGIRTPEQALEFIKAGAARIGTSSIL